MLLGVLTLSGCHEGVQPAPELYVLQPQVIAEVPRYELLELSFRHNAAYRNKFLDVDLGADLKSPSGVEHRVRGFFYGGDLAKRVSICCASPRRTALTL